MLEEHQPEDCIEDTSLAEQMCRSTGTKTTERERMEMSDGAEHSSGKELAAASVAESNQLQYDKLTFTGCFEWVGLLRWRRWTRLEARVCPAITFSLAPKWCALSQLLGTPLRAACLLHHRSVMKLPCTSCLRTRIGCSTTPIVFRALSAVRVRRW